jgi:hypothetical protein
MNILPIELDKVLIPFPGGRLMRGRDGVVIAAYLPEGDAQPVVLLADMQGRNMGASLTNSMEDVLNYVIATKFFGKARRDARWIQLDSMGYIDEVIPEFGANPNRVMTVSWRPLGCRSMDRFIREFGDVGEALIGSIAPESGAPYPTKSFRVLEP